MKLKEENLYLCENGGKITATVFVTASSGYNALVDDATGGPVEKGKVWSVEQGHHAKLCMTGVRRSHTYILEALEKNNGEQLFLVDLEGTRQSGYYDWLVVSKATVTEGPYDLSPIMDSLVTEMVEKALYAEEEENNGISLTVYKAIQTRKNWLSDKNNPVLAEIMQGCQKQLQAERHHAWNDPAWLREEEFMYLMIYSLNGNSASQFMTVKEKFQDWNSTWSDESPALNLSGYGDYELEEKLQEYVASLQKGA